MNTDELTEYIANLTYPTLEHTPSNDELDMRPSEYNALRESRRLAYQEARREHNELVKVAEAKWINWLREEYCAGLPTELVERVYELAWDQGHASGYYEVAIYYAEYGDLALAAYTLGKKAAQ